MPPSSIFSLMQPTIVVFVEVSLFVLPLSTCLVVHVFLLYCALSSVGGEGVTHLSHLSMQLRAGKGGHLSGCPDEGEVQYVVLGGCMHYS